MNTPTLVFEYPVVELRQYTLHDAGRRDTLIELFDREFIETQEAVGLHVMGQFRDLDGPDRFVWWRGFDSMERRPQALDAFYCGPVWRAHRAVANATMIDSDNVLLLRPAWHGAGLSPVDTGMRAALGASELPPGRLEVQVFPLRESADDALLSLVKRELLPQMSALSSRMLACYVTEPAANNFPALPLREGEPVLVLVALFDDDAAQARFVAHFDSTALAPMLASTVQRLRLAPTARSALGGMNSNRCV